MKINKIISFILMSIILVFSFCPLAFASVENNIITSDFIDWDADIDNYFISYMDYNLEENANTIRFLASNNNNEKLAQFYYTFDDYELFSNDNYELIFDFKDNNLANVSFEIYMFYSPDEIIKLFEHNGGDSLTYKNIVIKHKTPEYFSALWTPMLIISFNREAMTVVESNAFIVIKDLTFGVADSVEGNILKRIYNFIINLPATFQNFFTDLKNGISSFFTDLKTNLRTWFNYLKTSIGGFIDNLSDNLSEFFNKLKNWLLWFNAEGSSSYTNPFEQIDDEVDDDIESNIIKLANYINDNTQSVSDSLASVGSVFLVFDAFVVGIPLVLSLIIFAFFIHILKRLLGF